MAVNSSILRAAAAAGLCSLLIGCVSRDDSSNISEESQEIVCEVMGGGMTAIFPDPDNPGNYQCAVSINEIRAHYIISAWSLIKGGDDSILNYGVTSYESEDIVIFAFGVRSEAFRPPNLPTPTLRNAAVVCDVDGSRECTATFVER